MKVWSLLVLLPVLPAMAQVPDCNLLPGWQQHGPTRVYEADNLFEYMDGNAEGYLIYGYSKLQGVSCRKDGETVLIDVHEMANPESAWGIFAANRAPELPVEPIGTAGQVAPRKATFAKGNYLVEITAESEKDHSVLLRQAAQAMEKRIQGTTVPPAELAWFPAGAKSLRLIPESVLGIRLLKRGYLAQYETAKAFLVAEATPEAATATLAKLKARFGDTQPAKIADEGLQAKDRYIGNVAVFRKGRYVGGYANVREGQDAAALAATLASRIP